MKWKINEINFLKESYTKLGSKKCSEILNRTQGSTRKKAYELGIKSFKHHKPTYDIENICLSCGIAFKQKTKKNSSEYIKDYCSDKCAHKRIHSDDTKNKISESINEYNIKHNLNKKLIIKKCEWCGKEFSIYKSHKKKKLCSQSCVGKYNSFNGSSRKGGLSSVLLQNKRSKNEIYFSELCEKKFNDVECNKQIFNGWDADVIIHDIKTAVLWNGKWHYEKITKKHSLKQVQNRDKIKIKEIIEFGYKPYVIKDMGRYDKKFVKKEFNKFISGCSQVVRQFSHKE